jgi:hypothetical protein
VVTKHKNKQKSIFNQKDRFSKILHIKYCLYLFTRWAGDTLVNIKVTILKSHNWLFL